MKNNKSNIMVLDPAGNMWGSERVLIDFLNSKTASQRRIGLCCPPDTPLEDASEKAGVPVYSFFKKDLHRKGRFSRLAAAFGLYRACRRFKADVIYVNQAGAGRIALLVGKLLKIPVVPHVRLIEDVSYVESLRASLAAMPKVLAISEFVAAAFTDPGMKERLHVLYDAYSMKQEEADFSRDRSDALCCAGRLVPIKGQDVLVRAIAALDREGVQVSLNLFGTGIQGESFEAGLKNLVNELKLDDRVLFHGFVEDIPAEMQCHRTVICPSHTEPLGRVIFEAWDSSCLPISGKFSGGAAEIIASSGGGIIYNEQNPESLAEAIRVSLNLSEEDRCSLIMKGRVWLQENCNPEHYADRLLDILDMRLDAASK